MTTPHANWKEITSGMYRAVLPDGSALWLTPQGGFIINSNGQTIWESETVRDSARVEEEAQRLGLTWR